jgi:hypothetical protein
MGIINSQALFGQRGPTPPLSICLPDQFAPGPTWAPFGSLLGNNPGLDTILSTSMFIDASNKLFINL